MRSIIIKRRTLTLVILSILVIALLLYGWRGDILKKKNEVPGVEVNSRISDGSGFVDTVQPGQADNKINETISSEENFDFFVEYRLERERRRGQRVEYLREVINNEYSASEIRQKAQEHLLTASRNMEKEAELENLVRAKGFKDAAALVDEQMVTVIVAAASLSGSEALDIKELATRGTGVDVQNVLVIQRP